MRISLSLLLLVTTFLMMAILVLPAEASDPVGGCPDSFRLHMVMDHDNHHGDILHVGTDTDLNGDGWICGKHVSPNGHIHVHIDNNANIP